MSIEFKLPEVSEGVESADVAEILVSVGDTITAGQIVMEVETEKAVVELPCPHAGKIEKIHVSSGESIKVGSVLFTIAETAGATKPAETAKPAAPAKTEQPASAKAAPAKPASGGPLKVVVLGGGPGGYPAAFEAADHGFDVTLVDDDIKPGGVCLHRGCIPSKALLHVAKLIHEAKEANEWGLSFGEPKIDLEKLREFKSGVITKLTGGIEQLGNSRGVKMLRGVGRFSIRARSKWISTTGEAKSFRSTKPSLPRVLRPPCLLCSS